MGTWRKIRRVWATLGILALAGFAGWCLLAYRATGDARLALQSDSRVQVERGKGYWTFNAAGAKSPAAGLLFFCGALVDPAAYAPLARALAVKGYCVALVELPRRGALGGADGDEVMARARTAMQGAKNVPAWIAAGHSRGGAVASRLVRESKHGFAGLVLVGTSHPRKFSLADTTVPVVKILGSRDSVSSVGNSEQFRKNLPASTRWIVLEGANHSQFGHYGHQPGDRTATISREEQQARTIQLIQELLEQAAPIQSQSR